MDKNETIYNESTKNEFLSSYPENTRTTYNRIFVNSYELEESKQRDLYDFNVSELSEVLLGLAPKTPAASRTNGRIIAAYLDWAIEKGLRKNNINPFKKANPKWFDQFVQDIKIFINESELKKIENLCENAQDACIIRALFEGVSGMGMAELCNLKKNDVDFENYILHLTDYDGSKRDLKVSAECIRLIDQALRQTQYTKRNGEMDNPNGNLSEYMDLAKNNFVIRNAIAHTDNYNNHVDKHTIYRRVDVIRESTGFPYLTPKNIVKSGMIKMAYDLIEKYGELNKELYQEVANRFKVNIISTMYDYINYDQMQSLYGDK